MIQKIQPTLRRRLPPDEDLREAIAILQSRGWPSRRIRFLLWDMSKTTWKRHTRALRALDCDRESLRLCGIS